MEEEKLATFIDWVNKKYLDGVVSTRDYDAIDYWVKKFAKRDEK